MSDLPVFQRDDLLARLGGSRDALSRVVAQLERSIPDWLVQLPAAAAAGDADRLRRLAHQIKGALLTFAAPRAAEAALRLEESAREGRRNEWDPLIATLHEELERLRAAAVSGFTSSAEGGG